MEGVTGAIAGVMEVVCIFTVVTITRVCTSVKSHPIVHLRPVHITM